MIGIKFSLNGGVGRGVINKALRGHFEGRPNVSFCETDTQRPPEVSEKEFIELRPDRLPDTFPPGHRGEVLHEALSMTGLTPQRFRALKRLTGPEGASQLPSTILVAGLDAFEAIADRHKGQFAEMAKNSNGLTNGYLVTIASLCGGTGTPAAIAQGWALRSLVGRSVAIPSVTKWVHVAVTSSLLGDDLKRRQHALEHRRLIELEGLMRWGQAFKLPGHSIVIEQPGPDELLLLSSSPESPRTLAQVADELCAVFENFASERALEGKTPGSIIQQVANYEPKRATRRERGNGGGEVSAIGSLRVKAWSAAPKAELELCGAALKDSLTPEGDAAFQRAFDAMAHATLVTREVVREQVVKPIAEEVAVKTEEIKTKGISGMTARNSEATTREIFTRILDTVNTELKQKLEVKLREKLDCQVVRDRLDAWVREAGEGLTTVQAVVRHAKVRVAAEPKVIEGELREAESAAKRAVEVVSAEAREMRRVRLMGGDQALCELRRKVTLTVPMVVPETVFMAYGPPFAEYCPANADILEEKEVWLEARREAANKALKGMSESEVEQQASHGRTRIVGEPTTQALRERAITDLVERVRSTVAKQLRDLIVYGAPGPRLLQHLREVSRQAVKSGYREPELDEFLLGADADEQKVARDLARDVQMTALPVPLTLGADRQAIAQMRARVVRVHPGSRVAQALLDHAAYDQSHFDWSGSPSELLVVFYVMGIDLRDTLIWSAGDSCYEAEQADYDAPPLEMFSDAVLAPAPPEQAAAALA